ncbi:hypothetical protein LCGC14_0434050 [marine sediment metagenome]|uniref:Uncharacterized protein n=1 Tax=marine sediment metagenome TaxID=412755 RepID=A0A0F9SM57_9ZZZZ
MTIQQLLDMKLYEEANGFRLTVKHTHKITKVQGGYTQELTFTDDTGDILADMAMETYSPFVRRQEIIILDCEIQPSTKGKKLLVKKWEKVTCTADELPQRDPLRQNGPDWEAIGRGKVKHGLLCAYIQARISKIDDELLRNIAKLADWVMDPEDKWT